MLKFVFMSLVSVHTPTDRMYFYKCSSVGQVLDYKKLAGTEGLVEFQVGFQCPDRCITEWIPAGNLREVEVRDKYKTCSEETNN